MNDLTQTDVLIIGSGPAGLAAASQSAKLGHATLLLDEQAAPGGQIWRNAEAAVARQGGDLSTYAGAHGAIQGAKDSGAQQVQGATVLSADIERDKIEVQWLGRAPNGARTMHVTTARALIAATGAQERALAFPGATLPGVMGVGAIQTALKQGGLVPKGGENGGVVLAGQGPLLLLTLKQVSSLGGAVDAVLDMSRPGKVMKNLIHGSLALVADFPTIFDGMKLVVRQRLSGTKVYRNIEGLKAEGQGSVEQITFHTNGQKQSLPCSILGVHDGVIPNTQFTRLLGLAHHWDERQAAFLPSLDEQGRAPGSPIWVAGDGAGIAGADAAALRGRLCALDASSYLSHQIADDLTMEIERLKQRLNRLEKARRFIELLYPPLPVSSFADAATQLCRCEAVTFDDVREAVRSGAKGPNEVKTFTRCGMGPCQGRMCSNGLTRLISDELKRPADEVGALRIRPPLKPVLVRDYISDDEVAA